MCGILGIISKAGVSPDTLEAARDMLAHRGPDDAGAWHASAGDWSVQLGHRRLAIIDLTPLGHQPMVTSDGRCAIVFNGEIYNYRELRKALITEGWTPRSTSDTEVLLVGLRRFGPAFINRLAGMFAFAYWDGDRRQLLLARDRLGEKPLYMLHDRSTGDLAFASEPKALFRLTNTIPALDHTALRKYLAYLWVPDPHTLFRNVSKLAPAHVAVWEDGRVTCREYWDLQRNGANTVQDETLAVRDVWQTFQDSVRERLVADVTVGAFLSGGLDSSAVVTAMTRVADQDVVTESVGFNRQDQRLEVGPDDLSYARMVRASLNGRLDYHEHLLTVDTADLLPSLVWHFDDLVADPAALATYLISRAAKTRVTVLLTGTGAEECFAGYPRYWAALAAERYVGSVPHAVRSTLARISSYIPAGRGGALMPRLRHMRKFFRAADLPLPARFLGFRSYYDTNELCRLVDTRVEYEDLHGEHLSHWRRMEGLDPLSKMLYLDIKTYLPCLNLAYADRSSMACSVELRAPFLDHRMVELAWSLDSSLKLHNKTGKYVLRRAFAPYLPTAIVSRPKTGFGGPVRSWIRGPLAGYVSDMLSPAAVRSRGLVSPGEVEKIIREELTGATDNSLKIWALLLLELWCRRFLDGPLTPA